ncbi:flagellar basal body L-ring protein FlgH [Sphingomonas hankookensis]|uniref:flagellar basal body L-ring protein FlgH n=1 Tax=Sphingomonas hankookensis TaxID=563996 RepID=UPI001F575DBE|nr:flagellar basal body L-ring protein FlgH [Sphingomonas hankookensis]
MSVVFGLLLGASGTPCVAPMHALAIGDAIHADDLHAAACEARRPPALRYDRRSGLVHAAEPIAAGTSLGTLWIDPRPAVAPGDALFLRSHIGPAVIERRVTVLQGGRSGRPLFVRDGDGRVFVATLALTQDLFRDGNWSALAADRRASARGDVLTIVVHQVAESSNVTQRARRRATDTGGGIRVGGVDEDARISFGGGFSGRGEVRRSERLLTQLSVTIDDILPNGDLLVLGRQQVRVNGERTDIAVRGRVRPADISSDNSVLSSRIAGAEIDYDGKGFVTRGSGPGLIDRLFGLLGLG